jgi:ankyrin repeat protein
MLCSRSGFYSTELGVVLQGLRQFDSIATQPGVDRALSGMYLGRRGKYDTQMSLNLFTTDHVMAQQDFSDVHLVVLRRLSGDLESLLKEQRTNINLQDANGRTPLLWASWRGDTASVILLLKYGADIDKADNNLYTPLAKAAQAGHLSTVEILLTAKADMRIATSWGHEPIHLASEHRLNGHRVVEELLEWGANPNAYSKGSGTPLYNAANRGSIRSIKTLIDHGANVDAIGQNGSTPAMVALYCWNEPAFIYLTKAGARLDIVNDSGHNIVQLATWTGSVKVWDLLIERAESGVLGKIDVNALHEGHNIEQCYCKCRKLWYIGKKGDPASERAKFLRMIEICGFHQLRPRRLDDLT